MQVLLDIPDQMARKLAASGKDPSRAALEAMAIEAYRSGSLTSGEMRRLLGFETGYELDGFLKSHNIYEGAYGLEDLEKDRRTLQQLEAEGRLRA
ncbi:MAG TPA: UPF0175 family protein [Terracidiphilus sp.]|nr:UPF0175 family protein [Terracidiphilus sp.]